MPTPIRADPAALKLALGGSVFTNCQNGGEPGTTGDEWRRLFHNARMPDELATRATLVLMGGIVAGLALGALVAWLWRSLSGARSGGNVGVAAGLALFGAGMAWVAVDMAAVVMARSEQLLVRGTYEGAVLKTLRESARGGNKLRGEAPQVSFRTPDGVRHEITGLAGSQKGLQPGDAVPVRVDPRNPEGAVIDDFQNGLAALCLFALFAGVALLSAQHSLAHGVVEWREQRSEAPHRGHKGKAGRARQLPVPPSRFVAWRDGDGGQRVASVCRRTSVAVLAIGIVSLFLLPETMVAGRIFANGLAAVALSLLGFGAAAALKPGARPWLAFSGHAIGAIGLGGFAAILWLLTEPPPVF